MEICDEPACRFREQKGSCNMDYKKESCSIYKLLNSMKKDFTEEQKATIEKIVNMGKNK